MASTRKARSARSRFEAGPASVVMLSSRVILRKLRVVTGVGLAQPTMSPLKKVKPTNGPKMASAITGFLQREEARRGPISPDYPVFSFGKTKRTRIGPNVIGCTFHKLLPALQLTIPSGEASPHLHCLRHSFAVGTLLRWYRDGVDPMARLLDLSTFLGHVSPSSTAVYLSITTELLECASGRFAEFAMNSRKESVR